MNKTLFNKKMLTLALSLAFTGNVFAADHADAPIHDETGRDDARIADFWAFTDNGNLVLALTTNPFLPEGTTTYNFPTDVTFEIHIDNDSQVTFNDPVELASFGGSITDPDEIKEDISFEITFDSYNQPDIKIKGLPRNARDQLENNLQVFTGLRSEAFIFAPFVNTNIPAIVLSMPLNDVLAESDTVLLWSTSDVDSFSGKFQEFQGRALYSFVPANLALNSIHPKQHEEQLGLKPDVTIFDTSKPALFPNGRALVDDVVDMAAAFPAPYTEPTALNIEVDLGGFHADINDIQPFLSTFPFLAPPQSGSGQGPGY